MPREPTDVRWADGALIIRQWGLALRDLQEHGAVEVSVTLEGGATITRADGVTTVRAAGRKLVVPDEALDAHGLVLAEPGDAIAARPWPTTTEED